jgi:hypothetical protein
MDGESPAPLGVVGREAVGSGKKPKGVEELQMVRGVEFLQKIPKNSYSFLMDST